MLSKTKIIFLGGVFDEEKILQDSKRNVQLASNTLQWSLIKGLNELSSIELMNSVYVGTFPRNHKKLIEKSYTWQYQGNISVNNIGFINLFILKTIHRFLGVSARLFRTIRKQKIPVALIVYGMHTPFLAAAYLVKSFFKNLHICVIVTDLPEFMGHRKNKSKLFWFLKNSDSRIAHKLIKKFDSYVILTKHMKNPLQISSKPYVVVEGAIDEENLVKFHNSEVEGEKKIVFYGGGLNERNGIRNLVKAFCTINDPSFELWICGEGDEEEALKKLSQFDQRIKYFGLVPKERVYTLQSQATVLVNPRCPESGEYTKYSFPSKTMEYLLSGKPIIAYKLPGIPDEYDDFIEYVSNGSVEELANTILNTCNLPKEERDKLGRKGQQFVLEFKNGISQAEKILRMIDPTIEDYN